MRGLRMPSFTLAVIYAVWIFLFLDPHRFLASIGPDVIAKSQAVVFALLIAMTALRAPEIMSSARPWTVCPPLLVFALSGVASILAATHVGFARDFAQALIVYWIIVVATLAFVKTPRDATLLLSLFGIQFLWYAMHARLTGLVPWHSFLGNYDDFGALMAMGVGICFYLGMATTSKRLRWICFGLAGYCILAIVATFARGAFLSAVLVGGILWYRSPRKGLASAAIAVGGVLVLLVAATMYSGGEYWTRIMSSFEEGIDEGTGAHRWHLWNAAFNVFLSTPLVGAGGNNFGIYVVDNFGYESVYGYTSAAKLWNRSVHNIYMQILSELGLFGSLAFIWMIADFWKWNRRLRTRQFMRAWARATEGQTDLRNLSYALEMGMIGYLATSFFYGPLLYHWVYTLVAANLLLYGVTRRLIEQSARRPGRRPQRPAGLEPGGATRILQQSGIT